MDKIPVDFLFHSGTVVTMNEDREIITNASVAVNEGKISWIGSQKEALEKFQPSKIISLENKALIPGVINAHGHWAMTLFRGLVDDCPLNEWLAKIWQVEAEFVSSSPENVILGSQLAILEMLQFGTTCAADMYWFYPQTTQSSIDAGFRIINGPSFADIAGFENYKNTNEALASVYLEQYKDDPLVLKCIQAHSAYMTNPEMLENVKYIMEKYDLTFVTHAAESVWELELVQEKYGKHPIEVLDSFGLLGDHTVLAHCVHLSDADINLLAETGTSVAHCPSSNLKLSSGIARVAEMLKAGVNVAIGTDGPASNNDLNLFQEAQLAALVQKGITGDSSVLPAEKVFAMMTIDAAQAFRLDEKVGSIELGKMADLVVVDFESPNLTPCYEIYSHLIYALSGGDISHVMINGKLLMENRSFLTLDVITIKSRVRDVAEKIKKSLNQVQ
jgi:5-methylthioadenosine/S-adenosylhomocysteine deaminase